MKEIEFSPQNNNDNKNNSNRKKVSSPIVAAIKNFQLAKKLHKDNLEHDPLPDTITNSFYKKMQMLRNQNKDPGLALNEENFATGVGWKGYPGYGPTRCTKLKVYRPKTSVPKNLSDAANERPNSVNSFDLKWRFIRQRKVTPMELAIYWDLTPENPQDEPKRTPHIDGSNGSLAPAVFTLVPSPKEESKENSRKSSVDKNNGGYNCGTLFEKRPIKGCDEKDFILDRPKTSGNFEKRRFSRDSIKSGDSNAAKRAKSAYNINKTNKIDEGGNETCSNCCEKTENLLENNRNVHHQSTPNLSECGSNKKLPISRQCVSCELKKISLRDAQSNRNKNEYKMAFKAGVPQNYVSNNRLACYNRNNARRNFKVPKQKDPYCDRNYAIRSLAPPFSLQKDKRQDYPEHWRLATVYQHSYKPIHTRKRSLLATVFK